MNLEDFCRQNNIVIQYHKFSTKVRGFCFVDGEYYYIIINSRICSLVQERVIAHELLHILNDHLLRSCDCIEECEKEVTEKIGEKLWEYWIK